ncbi:MAG: DUF4209 domain-containing protein [Rhodomicrobiaceae bacterium]
MLFPSAKEISAEIGTIEINSIRDISRCFEERSVSKDDCWYLLQQLFGFHFKPSNLTEPFGPMMTDGDKRTMIPNDLTDEQLDNLKVTLEEVDDPEYRARVGDVLWLRRKDPNAARIAVEAYLEAGKRIEHPKNWTSSMERYERAVRLAQQIERNGELPKTILVHLEDRVIHYDGSDPLYFSSRALEFLAEFRTGDFTVLAAIAGRVAKQSCLDGDFQRARIYYEVQAKHLKLTKKSDQAEEARIAAARSYVEEAEAHEANGDYMAAHSFWGKAIRAFRDRPSLRAETPELQKRYSRAGEKLLSEMSTISSDEIDLSQYVEESRAIMRDLPWVDAFYELSSFIPLIDPEELRKTTKDGIAKHPLHTTISASIYDASGRKVGVRPSVFTEDNEEYEKAITGLMVQNAEQLRHLTIHAHIAPAVRQIIEDHYVNREMLATVLDDSSLIPPERRELFYQAIEAGFQWDFSTALHTMIPQVENALRHVLEQQGVTPVNVDNDGVEEVWGIERILSHPQTIETFGDKFVFELKSILVERLGPNLRNLIAHGALPPEGFKSTTAFYLWWVLICLAAYPTSGMRAFLERKKATAPSIKEN